MKTPAPPPVLADLRASLDPGTMVDLILRASEWEDAYEPWDKVRYRTPPSGISTEEWWFALRSVRDSAARRLPLVDVDGRAFSYALPDEVLRLCDEISSRACGAVATPDAVTNPATRDRYLVSSLIEEAITSSQLEGASTTRPVAQQMLRSGRAPRNHSEKMIVNNFLAMRQLQRLRDVELRPEVVLELHGIVTEGTLADPADAGRMQSDPDPRERVVIGGDGDQVLHRPPPVDQLPRRLRALCDFANGDSGGPWIHPVLRALTIHFMMGYDHYFADGNGRTARALFYWSMLKQGYWMAEYLSVSTILKKAPGRYARSFVYTEQDSGDLTYFYLYHLRVLVRALDELDAYLARKTSELRVTRQFLAGVADLNSRQVALLEHAVRDADSEFTAQSHATSHRVSGEAARKDLLDLERRGWLVRGKSGRRHTWRPVEGLAERIGSR